MKAIILAAGRGSRMEKLTDDRPKCLVELGGKALLEWQLSAIRNAGVQDIGIVTGYRRELLQKFGLVEFHNPRWADTNMVSSLECASEWLGLYPCIVSYSDIFYDATAITSLLDERINIGVTYDPNWRALWERRFSNPLVDAETFRTNGDGTLAEIGNRPTSIEDIAGQYMGILKFSPHGWAEIERIRTTLPPCERDRMHMTGTLQMVITQGRVAIHAIPYVKDWGEVDSAEDLRLYQPD